jgi:Asp-tRNA(Asn)/Glu-tRNA(Gln) amidotransferase A subunit family amidase
MYHPKMSPDAQPSLPPADLHDATRRRFLTVSTAAGLGSTLFPGALLALAGNSATAQSPPKTDAHNPPDITPEMIEQAAAIAGLTFTAEQRKLMIEGLTGVREDIVTIRKLNLPNSVAPSLVFDPVPGGTVLDTVRKPARLGPAPSIASISVSNEEQVAFASVRQLGELLRTRKVTSVELTKLYLTRLKRYDPTLHFVITLTEDRALKQAAAADAEFSAGKHRGPLHGIPWGGKDLLAVAGYPTTWGAAGFEDQHFDYDAEVVKRLDAAGAVLIAKLTMGALAQGDLWGYAAGTGKRGARTRNPWNPKQGSSGSSAGSASTVSAGCVGFALGTETLGSISSPSTRCGVTGLRPSFGLVPRTGAMALSWSMDKIGPITRSVEDCAIVLQTIYGPDGRDLSVQPAAFNPDLTIDIRKLRVGYIKSGFDAPTFTPPKPPSQTLSGKELDAYNQRIAQRKANFAMEVYDAKFNTSALETLRSMGVSLTPVSIPDFPFGSIVPMLEAEAAAAFDDLTRSGRDSLLSGQAPYDWPNSFRTARLYSAVDYINAARARTLALQQMTETFAPFDVIVTPSEGEQLTATNLCGQPAVIVPNGIRGDDAPPSPHPEDGAVNNAGGPGTPVSLTFLAPLYQDAKAVALAHAYQLKTGFHLLHPKLT